MDSTRVAEAARLLLEARRTGIPLRELPPQCKPNNAADANDIADEVTRQLGEPIAGWKITFVYKPREKAIRAPIFAGRVFSSPAEIPLSLTPSHFIEPEVTFRLVHDLPPRERIYSPQEVADAVAACPAFEAVDTRFDTSYRGIRQMLNERSTLLEAYADHITNGAFVIGEPYKDWQRIDFAKMRVAMRTEDKMIVETVGGHAFIDPFLPVVVLANELRRGPGLQAGQTVATGSFTGFFPAEIGQPITAEFAGLGRVKATFVR
jgi:2-keto-4-pentenoate hydratase